MILTWRNAFCFLAIFGTAGYVLSDECWPLTILGVILLVYALYPSALLLVPRWRRVRPPLKVIRIGLWVAIPAVLIWLTSMFLSIEIATTTNSAWILGDGDFKRMSYRTRTPRFPAAPGITVKFEPTLMPIGGGYIAMGNERGGSSRTVSWALWPIPAAVLLPSLVLRQLRRQRYLPGFCRNCQYNLTGNVSGICPECGMPIKCDGEH